MDNINKFILELNTGDTDKVLKEYLPTNFHSNHFKNKTISGENKIIILIKSVLLCIVYFSKFFLQILFKKKQKIKSKYKLLVYVPNLKFERYYLSLFNRKESLDNLVTVSANNTEELIQAFAHAKEKGIFIESFFMEPVMGEGDPGLSISPEFYQTARELTTKNGTLLIVDSDQLVFILPSAKATLIKSLGSLDFKS